jgi:3',5'-cyclic AMP phosphodiesterase CpdA
MDGVKHEAPGAREAAGPTVGGAGAYTLAHLSDPHLSTLEGVRVRELVNKRVLGYLSWRRRRRLEHRPEVLQALVRDLEVIVPEHIVVTGDLTHLGLPTEFEQVSAWLKGLAGPLDLTVIPGNHEAYVSVPAGRTLALWGPYMASDPAHQAEERFPSLRVRGPLALIGLSSASPTAPFMASGRMGARQLARLRGLLAETGRRGLIRVLMVHHPPTADVVGWRKRLVDAEALRAIIKELGVELVLHGHAHRPVCSEMDTPRGRAPVFGVPSASAAGTRPGRHAQYHLYRFIPNARELQVTVRGYRPAQQGFATETVQRLTLPGQGAAF